MSILDRHKRSWDKLGELDPLWVVLTDPKGKFGKWDVDEFFTTGQKDMAVVLATAEELGYPKQRETALDFGCGVGRLTRGMAKYFKHCHGIDISESMIAKAKELNQAFPNCQFSVNYADHLGMFPDNQFDFICSNIVLQHLPTRTMIKSYIAEFCPGFASEWPAGVSSSVADFLPPSPSVAAPTLHIPSWAGFPRRIPLHQTGVGAD